MHSTPGLELWIWKGKAIFKKGTLAKQKGTKAIQEKAQRQKERKKKKRAANSKGGGGGGDSDTFFFPTSKKKIPPEKQKKKKIADSSVQPQLTPLHSMQNALQCQWHALWSASAWNYVDKWKKKKKLTLMFQNVQCFAHFVMIVRKFRILPFSCDGFVGGNHKNFPSLRLWFITEPSQ